jgi:hypothetical protein
MSVLQTWHVTFALGACSYYGALMAYGGVHQVLALSLLNRQCPNINDFKI